MLIQKFVGTSEFSREKTNYSGYDKDFIFSDILTRLQHFDIFVKMNLTSDIFQHFDYISRAWLFCMM